MTQLFQPPELDRISEVPVRLEPGSVIKNRFTVQKFLRPIGPLNCYLVHEPNSPAKWCAQCGAKISSENFCQRCGFEFAQNQFWLLEGERAAANSLRKLVAAGLNHDGLLPLLEYFTWNRRHYVLALFCPGETLASAFKMDTLSGFNWILTVGNAIEYLHFHGFYGVDFSMDTIFLRADGPKLAGLWKCKFRDKTRTGLKKIRRSERKDLLIFARWLSQLQRRVNDGFTGQGLMAAICEIKTRALQGNFSSMSELMRTLRQLKKDAFEYPAAHEKLAHNAPVAPKLILGQSSHRGMVRQMNEDSVATFEFTRILESVSVPVCLCVVADGMGGHQNGEIASRLAVETITEGVNQELLKIGLENLNPNLAENQIKIILTTALLAANEKISRIALAKQSDMGATVTLALVIEHKVYLLNVGDCRTYHFDGAQLQLITADHSLVYRLYQTHQIEYAAITAHPQRHQILRCLGEPNLIEHLQKMERQANHPYWFTQSLQPGESLLLCSDGLWEMLAESRISESLRSQDNPQTICDDLVTLANQQGGEDNISLVLIQMK
jgi:serine/threonine protein phosphatase PrpC